MKNNQGVPEDNQKTPPVPEYIPPLTIFAPWCFQVEILEFADNSVAKFRCLLNVFFAVGFTVTSRVPKRKAVRV